LSGKDTDARLADMLAKQDIHDALMRYCRGIDRCDAELLESVYHPDAIDDHGTFVGKASEFIPWVIKGLREEYLMTTHAVSNVLIEVEGDTGWAESYVNSWHLCERDGKLFEWTFSGRYVDRFERRGGQWKIAHRVTVFDSESLRPAPEEQWLPDGAFPTTGKRSREDPVYAR
jgi:SnoaL-like domain